MCICLCRTRSSQIVVGTFQSFRFEHLLFHFLSKTLWCLWLQVTPQPCVTSGSGLWRSATIYFANALARWNKSWLHKGMGACLSGTRWGLWFPLFSNTRRSAHMRHAGTVSRINSLKWSRSLGHEMDATDRLHAFLSSLSCLSCFFHVAVWAHGFQDDTTNRDGPCCACLASFFFL